MVNAESFSAMDLDPSDQVLEGNRGLETAREIVKRILDQITLHDSPPVNDELMALIPGPSQHNLKEDSQHHHLGDPSSVELPPLHKVSPFGDMSINSSDVPEMVTATRYMAEYKQRQKQSEIKLGNVALATLCHKTLESTNALNRVEAPEVDENTAPKAPQVLMIDTTEPMSSDPLYSTHRHEASPNKEEKSPLVEKWRDPPALDYTSVSRHIPSVNLPTPRSGKKAFTRGADWSPTQAIDPPPTRGSFRDPNPTFEREQASLVALVNSLSSDEITEQDRGMSSSFDESASGQLQRIIDPIHRARISKLTQGPRLQMFGSEYARFLSETPFSPDRKVAKKKAKKKPRHSFPISRPNTRFRPLTDTPQTEIFNLEDAEDAILTGAITDIIATQGATLPPRGYYCISQTFDREDSEGGEQRVYLNVKKEPNWDRAAQRPCVTALAIIFPERQEVVPPGFCVVSVYEGGDPAATASKLGRRAVHAANLNNGTEGERVYLCYRRSREGNPITGLLPLQPNNFEPIPEGYTVLERSPRNHVASIHMGGGDPIIFLGFRQRLASLEPLRPLPLLLSVYSDTMKNTYGAQGVKLQAIFRKATLRSYYCTGGTTVAASIGKFHIMDRSTHALLSPSSIKNRLTLIQTSRLKTGGSVDESTMSSNTGVHAGSLGIDVEHSGYSITNTVSGSHSIETIDEDDESFEDLRSAQHGSFGSLGSAEFKRERMKSTFFSQEDSTLRLCLSSMRFIPVIETPYRENVPSDHMSLDARIALLTPIVTSCYTQHGGAAMLAVEGLTKLLNETSFFQPDRVAFPEGEGSDSRLTLLDIAIQSVCDIATSTVRETCFLQCIDFVKSAVEFAEGHLNTRTIGYVLRFYLFIFYFGASLPTTSSAPNTVWPSSENYESASRSLVANSDVPFLFEVESPDYLRGGAPQAAVLALKRLVTLLLNRIVVLSYAEKMRVVQDVKNSVSVDDDDDPLRGFFDGVISNLVDNAVRRVELANYTQLAYHQIHRSGGSELFWYDMMTSCGNGMFASVAGLPAEAKSVYMISFSLLANIVKVCSGSMRRVANNGALIARDIASKLLSLELLGHFLTTFHETEQKEYLLEHSGTAEYQKEGANTLIYSMRRLVIPCLLTNTVQGLQDARVYRRLLRIVSIIWKAPNLRKRMKMELGVVVEQFGVRLLNLGPQLLTIAEMHQLARHSQEPARTIDSAFESFQEPLFKQQVDLLFEFSGWFKEDARGLLEFFLNFDTDISHQNEGPTQWMPGSQWKLCERIFGSICVMAEQCGNVIANQIKDGQVTNEGPLTPTGVSSEKLTFDFGKQTEKPSESEKSDASGGQMAALVEARVAARQLQSTAFGVAFQFVRSLAVAAATSAGSQEADIVIQQYPISQDESLMGFDTYPSSRSSVSSRSDGDETILSYWQTAIAAERKKGSVSRRGGLQAATSFDVSNSYQDDLDLPVKTYAHGDGASNETLRIAFRIIETKNLKKGIEYLIGRNYLSPTARDVATFLRVHHTRINTKKLGEYLGEGGLNDAEIEYWNLIRFNYVRSISFVGMTVEEGLRHFLTNCGFRLAGEAQQIDRVMTTFSQCYWEDNAGDYYRCPFDDQDTVFLLSFAIIMLNTDLHKVSQPTKSKRHRKKMTKPEFLNNLRDVCKDDELSHEYLSEIYDSVEASPIELFEEPMIPMVDGMSATADVPNELIAPTNMTKTLKSMIKNVKKSEELLRGLSVHEFRFYSIEDYADFMSCDAREALADISHSAFASAWKHYDTLIKGTFKIAYLDPGALALCVPLVRACLSISICLGLRREVKELLHQLAFIKTFADKSKSITSSHNESDWFGELQFALADRGKVAALEYIEGLMSGLEESLRVDSRARKQITRVVRRIFEGQFLLNDPIRAFVKEGYLMKKSHRMGRSVTNYHFFLFSDLLVYAKPAQVTPGEKISYNIHEVLSLHLMKITDWYPNSKKQTDKHFTIHHPRKSFTVVCSTVQERKEWVTTIRHQIHETLRRLALSKETRDEAAQRDLKPVPASCL